MWLLKLFHSFSFFVKLHIYSGTLDYRYVVIEAKCRGHDAVLTSHLIFINKYISVCLPMYIVLVVLLNICFTIAHFKPLLVLYLLRYMPRVWFYQIAQPIARSLQNIASF